MKYLKYKCLLAIILGCSLSSCFVLCRCIGFYSCKMAVLLCTLESPFRKEPMRQWH